MKTAIEILNKAKEKQAGSLFDEDIIEAMNEYADQFRVGHTDKKTPEEVLSKYKTESFDGYDYFKTEDTVIAFAEYAIQFKTDPNL